MFFFLITIKHYIKANCPKNFADIVYSTTSFIEEGTQTFVDEDFLKTSAKTVILIF